MMDERWIAGLTDAYASADLRRQILTEMQAALSGDDEQACGCALRAINHVGMEAAELRLDLVRLWKSTNRGQMIRSLVNALARIKDVPTLIEALRSDEHAFVLRRCVPAALSRLGPAAISAVPELIATLHDKEDRTESMRALREIGAPAVPALLRRLSDDNALLRFRILHDLGVIGSSARGAMPTVIRALDDSEENVRSEALFALRHWAPLPDAAIARIARCLKDESEKVRNEALVTLQCLGPSAAAGTMALTSFVSWDVEGQRPDNEVLIDTLRTLAAIGPAAADAAGSRLRAILADPDECMAIRCEAALSLWHVCGDASAAAATLRELAQQSIPPERRALLEAQNVPSTIWECEKRRAKRRQTLALRALFKMGIDAGDCTDIMVAALNDEDTESQLDAIRAAPDVLIERNVVMPNILRFLGHADERLRWETIHSLLRMAVVDLRIGESIHLSMERGGWDSHPSASDIHHCQKAIHLMRTLGSSAAPLIPTLKSLRDRYTSLKTAAIFALAHIREDVVSAVPELIAILADTAAPCRCQAAANYLGEIGPAARDAVPHLVRLARYSPNYYNRIAAFRALLQIDPGTAKQDRERFT